jgi:palmitoyltransferase
MADWHTQITSRASEAQPAESSHTSTEAGQAFLPVEEVTPQAAKERLVRQVLEDLAAGNLSTLVQAILHKQVDIDFKDASGYCALHLAVWRVDYKAVNLLLSEAACPVDLRTSGGYTPLMLAVIRGDLYLIKLFLDRGADIEAHDETLATPILLSAQHGLATAFLILKHRGADLSAVDMNGCSVAHWAAYRDFPEFLRMLKVFHIPLDSPDSKGITPLHRACESNAVHSITFLLRNGSNAQAKTAAHKTPLEIAGDGKFLAAEQVLTRQEGTGSCRGFKYLYVCAWIALYLDYVVTVLPSTAHFFYASLAFNLSMLLLPVSFALLLLSHSGELVRQPDSPDTGVVASVGEAFETGNFNEVPDASRICFSCNVLRPVRSKHCRYCNKCIPRQDHHSAFLGMCIGEQNHRRFVVSVSLTYMGLVLFLYLQLQHYTAFILDTSLSSLVVRTVLVLVESADFNVLMTLLSVPAAWYTGWYLFLEVHAISQGLTVNEVLNRHRYRYLFAPFENKNKVLLMRFKNPFTKGVVKNWMEFLGR